MLCTMVILVLAGVLIVQNRTVLYGIVKKVKQAWGTPPPPAA